MPTRFVLRLAILMVLSLASSDAWAQGDVKHMPVVQATSRDAISVRVSAPSQEQPELHLYYRGFSAETWNDLKFQRQGADMFVAVIPADAVATPGVEYFIAQALRGNAGQESVFASAAAPHRILVRMDTQAEQEEQILNSHRGRRSKVHVATEWVNFGDRRETGTLDDGSEVEYVVADNYLRVDLDFTYRLIKLPIRSLRFGYTRLVGDARVGRASDECFGASEHSGECSEEVGYKVGGWFEVGFGLRSATSIELRGMVLATAAGFTVGGRSELRIGDRDGTHLAGGLEMMADVGSSLFLRMGWDSVPDYPMALTIAGSDVPSRESEFGVRVIYSVAREVYEGLRLGVRLNYQSRDESTGALGGGLTSSFEF